MTIDYSKTVHLPRTNFPMKGDLPKREPPMQEQWEKSGIYEKLQADRERESYTLHDGPPYANGHIHIGHALNKILKDIVVKSRLLLGQKAPYRPGWDCHGLPIETALLKEKKMGKRDVKDVLAFRKDAKDFAQKFIGIQREGFRRLGVLGEWDHPYTTMSPEYEAGILQAFRRLLLDGYIYRGLKPVYWCVYCETALAEAEVEYKDKTSPSVYVAFPIQETSIPELKGAEVLIWTTTPWTLPANMAVALHPDLEYVLAEVQSARWPRPRRLLLAKARLEAVLSKIEAASHRILKSWTGRELALSGPKSGGSAPFSYRRPFGQEAGLPVLGDYVTAEDGTGIVHTAPGHGEDDFHTGKKYNLGVLCPVDSGGRFTSEVPEFAGKRIFEGGNPLVVENLAERQWLLRMEKVQHSYPHCWRCKNPIAFRATEQWFLSVNHNGLRERLLKAIDGVRWVPAEGKNRISAMVQNRPDWCLSRQRVWGTPIPILYCDSCGKPSSDWEKSASNAYLEALEQKVSKEGADFWFESPEKKISLGPKNSGNGSIAWDFVSRPMACPCGGTSFRRETDILDVWVDSGASWLAVMKGEVSDLYLEGSDQHRGWFQSSLVLSVALTGRAPYKTVLTHGMVLDDKGRAMHKSLGNVVSPQQVIDKYGADVLRLWVALADYSTDVRLSDKLLEVPAEAYRKIRNTLRYLLGSLSDFNPASNQIETHRLPEMDRYILHRFFQVSQEALKAYEEYRFRDAARALTDFCNLELSSFYLDSCKDKLYTLSENAFERRASQTAMFLIVRSLVPLIAPILSYTAEEAWAEMRRLLKEQGGSTESLEESVFLVPSSRLPLDAKGLGWSDELQARWREVLEIRQKVNKALEEKRLAGVLGSSLQAKVRLGGSKELLERYKAHWPEILIVSQVDIAPNGNEVSVEVSKAEGAKCARCWRFQTDVGATADHPAICGRCVRELGSAPKP